MGFPIRLAIKGILHELPTLNQITHLSYSCEYIDIDSEFTVLAINISVLFRASGAPALVEVNVQVHYKIVI